MRAPDEASAAQIRAAQPGISTWLSANAGSGKTRVLTDRVARLLLSDVAPQNILCLTFTKAAAAEMQNRLFARLGAWAMLADEKLRNALREIGEDERQTDETLLKARRLFARAIETPGGLKIQTIHSFCANILRRFPLEAGVPPGFTEMDELRTKVLVRQVLDQTAAEAPEAFDHFASLYSGQDIEKFCLGLMRHRDGYAAPPDFEALLAQLGLPEGFSEERLLADVFLGGERELIASIVPYLASGSTTDAKAAATLANLPDDPMAMLNILFGVLLFGASAAAPFGAKIGKFPTKKTSTALPPEKLAQLDALMGRVETARDSAIRLKLATRSDRLHAFAHAFLPRYEAAKSMRGELDFDDLILKTRALLTRPGIAEWVLFRLDGGIDHILVDEAQDTSPEQWQVIDLLTREITSGSGTREAGERTIFVVGDKKQSIYGFQGADPDGFERMSDEFATRLDPVNAPFQRMDLRYSFRSANPILRVVDAAFPDAEQAMGGALDHIAFHDTMPGRVDLWPFIEKEPDEASEEPWFVPVDMVSDKDPQVQLGQRIAREILRMKAEESLFQMQEGTPKPRRIEDGDILILVQRRKGIFHEVIRACKAAGLEVAGADRVKLNEALAVKDLLALLYFLVTPEDDLSLASALRSPLFGWSEDDLFRLAQPRGNRTLWQALREAESQSGTRKILSDLLNHADFFRPYELLDRILRHYKGRTNLLARLGIEAEDSIDLLLSTALSFEQAETPSLTGFLAWLEASDIEIKRGQGSGNAIRVMTVHGAKGLESPIVILAESGDRRAPNEDGPVDLGEGMPLLWKPNKLDTPTDLLPHFETRAAKLEEERLRLQYVAMTRAEQWLIVCGAGAAKKDSENWYHRVQKALEGAGAIRQDFAFGGGARFERWPEGASPPVSETPKAEKVVDLSPDFLVPAPIPERPVKPIAPSSLPGAKTLPGEEAGDPDAMERGTAIHKLLEHLPELPEQIRAERGREMLAALHPDLPGSLVDEALGVMASQSLSWIFGPETLAEVPLTAQLNGAPLQGIIDRLIVTERTVTAIDYKTNRVLPDHPEQTPPGLLAQLGAYAATLKQIYPAHEIKTGILWTAAPRLDILPHDLVAAALAATST